MAGNQNSGGARAGAGRKKKPLAQKLTEGNPGHRRLEVVDFGGEAVQLEGADMPKPGEMLSAVQRDGSVLQADEIYRATWLWLSQRSCAALVSPQLLERYAMAAARWVHCETIISNTGYLAKHPTTGAAIASPYVSMSQNYMNQTNRLWMEIYQIVKDNCSGDYQGANPQDDVMERLLRARNG